jgi:hypothetical protein
MKKTITESELKEHILQIYKEEQEKILQEKWDTLSKEDRIFVVEFLRSAYPEKSKLLKEAKWYNTLGDLVGIFDPTGIVDLVNGVSYIHQGDNLFGILSIISAVPIVGKIIGKPLMGSVKIGSKATKAAEIALDAAKLGNFTKSEKILTKLAGEPGAVGSMVRTGTSWAPKATEFIEKIPAGPFKGLKNTIMNWFGLFGKASENSKFVTKTAGELATKVASTISKEEKISLLSKFAADAKKTSFFNPSNFYKSSKSVTNLWGGMPRLFGNREIRALMRKTKFWLGFLDWVGLGNFVGPDEAAQKLGGEEAMQKKIEEYQKTPEAKKYFDEDFKEVEGEMVKTDDNKTDDKGVTQAFTGSDEKSDTSDTTDPLSSMFKSMLTGALI